jgi:exopolysaccharide biosynthesis polyprenyl glycosylphosphotransferase
LGGSLGSGARRPDGRADRDVVQADSTHFGRRRRDPGVRLHRRGPAFAASPVEPRAGNRLSALRAQRTFRLVALRWAPAVVALVIAYLHSGAVGEAVLIGGSVLAASIMLDARGLPMHLMPIAGFALLASIPVVGVGIAFGLSLALAPLEPSSLIAPALGAAIVLALSAWELRQLGKGIEVRLAIAGSPEVATSLVNEFERMGLASYRLVGWLGAERTCAVAGAPDRLGGVSDIREVVERNDIDLIVNGGERVAGEIERGVRSSGAITERIAEGCLGLDVRMVHLNDLCEQLFGRVSLARMNAAFFEDLMHPDTRRASSVAKRVMDVAIGGAVAVIAAPLVALAAVAIKLTDTGPVFFRQRRVGEGGREFEIVKLRTMSADAESEGAEWSSADDERVTRVGRILRRGHIDELPQLWNVMRGQMSLVGPRPERPEMVAELELEVPFYDRRELIQPGITGWAQVRCGYAVSDEDPAWTLCYDLYYLKHRSTGLDLAIMLEALLAAARDTQFEVTAPDERLVLDAVRRA